MKSRYSVPMSAVLAILVVAMVSPRVHQWLTVIPKTAPVLTGWSSKAACPLARCEAQGAAFANEVYVIGGYYTTTPSYQGTLQCDRYDATSNSWTRVADMPTAITHAGVAVTPTYIVLAGGYPLKSNGWQTFACTNVNAYDPAHNRWVTNAYPPLPAARGAGAMVYINNQLHFLSGVNIDRVSQITHWVLNLKASPLKWVTSTPLPSGRNHVAAIGYNNKIYLIGGQPATDDSAPSDALFIFDTITQKWSAGARMLKARSHHADSSFLLNGQIIVVGGITTGAKPIADINGYDPATNHWYAITPSLPAPRHSPIVQPALGKFVCTTGYYPPGFTATTFSTPYK